MMVYDLFQRGRKPRCFLHSRQTAIERSGSYDVTGGGIAGCMRCCGARVHLCQPVGKRLGSVTGNDLFGGRPAERGSRRTVLNQPPHLGRERFCAVRSYQLIIQREVVGA